MSVSPRIIGYVLHALKACMGKEATADTPWDEVKKDAKKLDDASGQPGATMLCVHSAIVSSAGKDGYEYPGFTPAILEGEFSTVRQVAAWLEAHEVEKPRTRSTAPEVKKGGSGKTRTRVKPSSKKPKKRRKRGRK